MKAKEKDEKQNIKLRYAVGLSKALEKSKFKSFRDLALHTGFETAHIQRIATGKVDVVLTSCIALAEGLGLGYSELSSYYDQVTDKEIEEFLENQEKRKRKPIANKKAKSTKGKR